MVFLVLLHLVLVLWGGVQRGTSTTLLHELQGLTHSLHYPAYASSSEAVCGFDASLLTAT